MKPDDPIPDQIHGGPADSLPVWEGELFGEPNPLRIYFLDCTRSVLNGILGWLDLWHSGLLTRSLKTFYRSGTDFPESFLFFPSRPPLSNGFLVVPYWPLRTAGLSGKLQEIVSNLKCERVIIDGTTLTDELSKEIGKLKAGQGGIPFHISDPSDIPASCLVRNPSGVTTGSNVIRGSL
jgi:hypothetical protein